MGGWLTLDKIMSRYEACYDSDSIFGSTIVFLPEGAGSLIEELASINHCIVGTALLILILLIRQCCTCIYSLYTY